MNDPNGLCLAGGTWHAFYQHNPHEDVWAEMHWRHATSRDLTRWLDEGIALAPDELGQIFSGSIVIDHGDTAGFGRGAMVAVFTHERDGVQSQSMASSRDGGTTWRMFAGNPVLTGTAPDFRDPKVIRVRDGWTMSLAVGDRIEFYRASNLRDWRMTGEYHAEIDGAGVWECPDLFPLRTPHGDVWALTFCAMGVGPHGHGGTVAVLGEFDGATFNADREPTLVDLGPDFYAMQSFHGTAHGTAVAMAWMNSWRYARTLPSSGRRGVLSVPRALRVDDRHRSLLATPAIKSSDAGVLDGRVYTSAPDHALLTSANGSAHIAIGGACGSGATVEVDVDRGLLTVERTMPTDGMSTERFEAPLDPARGGSTVVLVDHGMLEVFAAGGSTTMSLLTFTGPDWAVRVDGDAVLTRL